MRVLSRRADHPGLEWCEILDGRGTISIDGVVLLKHKGKVCRMEYSITCDSKWQTRRVSIRGSYGRRKIPVVIRADERRRWYRNGMHVASVEGCVDVDPGFSPSTNLLPIRGLHPRVRRPVEVKAAWVEFPSTKLKPLLQTYLRKSERTIHYEGAGGGFPRDLETNPRGLVIKYPRFWEAELVE